MTKVAIVYYSCTGYVHQLAAAAAAAAEKAGAEVRLRRIADEVPDRAVTEELAIDRQGWAEHAASTADVPEATLADLEWADAILVGTSVRFGLPAPALMRFIDTTTRTAIAGNLLNKAVSAFACGDGTHAGHETTILALHNSFCHWGSVIVSNGITDPVLYRPHNGCPYGTSSVSKLTPGTVHEDNIAAVEFQTRRTVEIAAALRRGFASAPR
ncbi:flavodoxin family protein [Streptomyces sp. URMC 123]|uniref:flavodoxin family protein n=1 Tax=Streptomyces sp. URMC 123 TaxID=3423403 RepID=UPI003F1D8B01